MEESKGKGLTLLQWLFLVALLGLILTVAAALWQGPQSPDAAAPLRESIPTESP